ncbi:lipopolysaccharide-induced tumor necrosis factor-alpha factor homolog [Temnothorax curvispinosus]|uniref:Lipopolysaccharide-induced tumor necrosis factor-alpha factor homolog n=1 Tax=Temnothorax curvispinosus TaxID=300111 RepID=A0A6J1QIA7_9HYME|nr:lipopolysaccharide-induced tumor necrosis factor-alpha factor homolog [Temnothorax curvispinosus]
MKKMDHPPSYTSPPYPQPQYPYPQPPPTSMPSMPSPPHTVHTIVTGTAFSNESQHMTCPHCHATISTRVDSEANTKTHLIAVLLCLFGCWCCAPCPYCMDSCLVHKHYCPACDAFLGASEN